MTVPLAGPMDGTWDELRATLKTCWADATALSNWAVSELAKAEPPRTAELARMPPMPRVYLYGAAKLAGMERGDSTSRTALLTAVERKYRQKRLNAIWRRSESLPSYRYPTPYPVHNQSWSAQMGPDNVPLVSVRLGGRRWSLRLRVGPHFRRQLAAHRLLATGAAVKGELAIYEVPAGSSDHRNGVDGRAPGGGRSSMTRVMVKMVAWLPRSESGPADGILYCRTSSDSLWTYRVGTDGEPKYYHADHVRRWVAEHRRRLGRMADDLKYEKRWPKPIRKRMVESQESSVQKARNRLDSFCHQATAMLAGYAQRQHIATVVYDDTDKSYVDRFPWYMLKDRLKYKLAERGIGLELVSSTDASDGVVDENPDDAREL